MQFVADLEPNPDGGLQIMYGIDGRRDLTESTLDHLSGYDDARPVRVGNGAYDQRQNDVYGAVLDSLLLQSRRSQRLPSRLWPIVRDQAECALKVWREPDQGIWEARGDPQHYVSSKLMCWVALDRASKLAGIARRPEAPRRVAAPRPREIQADILEHGVDERGVLKQHYDAPTGTLDASNAARPHPRASCPAATNACTARVAGDRGRPHRGRVRAPLPGRTRRTTGCRARRAASSSARSGSCRPW